ncbi:MAG TPA: hypothetical protein VGC79_16700 [Polyangiaceae bacterium]
MSAPNRYFLATPILDGRVHHAYMTGALQMSLSAESHFIIHKSTGSYMPQNRDSLTHGFLRSDATHMLCVDPDIGWGPSHVAALAQANKDFITGIYALKQPHRAPSAALLTEREGELIEALHTAPGFLLLTRSCVERMVLAHPELVYENGSERVCSLWSPRFEGKLYSEDLSFCARWRALGGQIWAHSAVLLKRYADTVLLPPGLTEAGARAG